MHYFAYGSNMLLSQMKHRCPDSTVVCRGVLGGWQLYINERGVASVWRDPESEVHGVIYDCSPQDVANLDRHEGVWAGRYGRFYMDVRSATTKHNRRCVTYIDPSAMLGAPRKGYLEKVIAGAMEHHLPASHIQFLEERGWEV